MERHKHHLDKLFEAVEVLANGEKLDVSYEKGTACAVPRMLKQIDQTTV